MSEIFISYARATEAIAIRAQTALQALGHAVWRDDALPAHRDFGEVIEERLQGAKAILVLWSADAVRSDWVKAEAEFAREASTLVQARLDGCRLPMPFNRVQCADLAGWAGGNDHPGWQKVTASIAALLQRPGGTVAAPPPLLSLPDRPSIAVLPFNNRSNDADQEYFADAVTEDITTALSHWHRFFVIASTTSFTLKGRTLDPARIGAELGVRYLCDGSVRRSGERVRVTARLIDSSDGAQLWGGHFDRGVADVLALQDEITEGVVRAIEPALLSSENVRLARKPPADYSALDCFQRGMWHLNKVSADHYADAVALFRQAIARDPLMALGHIGLSRILYGGATIYGWSQQPDADLKESYSLAKTAIGLDSGDADGFFALSGAALYLGQHGEALSAARRAVQLNPNLAYAHLRLAQVLIYAGQPAEAIEPTERCLRHSPFDPQTGAMLGVLALAHYQSRDYAAAVVQARAAVDHGFLAGHAVLAAALARLGRVEEAHATLPAELLGKLSRDAPRLATYVDNRDRDHLMGGLMLAGLGATPRPAPPPP